MTTQTITCPLCDGTGLNHASKTCPECKGSGQVYNHFQHVSEGHYETDEETAEAEGRPIEEVRREREEAKKWIEDNKKGQK